MAKKEKEKVVIEAETTEVEENVSEETEPATEFTIGMNQDGTVYYRIRGTKQSLVVMDGLMKYADKVIQGLWHQALTRQDKEEEK